MSELNTTPLKFSRSWRDDLRVVRGPHSCLRQGFGTPVHPGRVVARRAETGGGPSKHAQMTFSLERKRSMFSTDACHLHNMSRIDRDRVVLAFVRINHELAPVGVSMNVIRVGNPVLVA